MRSLTRIALLFAIMGGWSGADMMIATSASAQTSAQPAAATSEPVDLDAKRRDELIGLKCYSVDFGRSILLELYRGGTGEISSFSAFDDLRWSVRDNELCISKLSGRSRCAALPATEVRGDKDAVELIARQLCTKIRPPRRGGGFD
ncbi:MAG: hypothetical protein AAF367_03490 [Pseudomonadota bacterium]